MARSYDYTVKVTLPIYGEVTAEIQYHIGFSGSYWEPPDSDEVTVEALTNADGQKIDLSDDEWERFYDLFLTAGGEAHSSYMDEWYAKCAKEWEEDREIPF
jgi:hypothetical protein